jgi:ABC-type sugar transport system permease subunit
MMSLETSPNTPSADAPPRQVWRIWLGLLLLAPAGLCCLLTLVLPTLQTFITSLQKVSPIGASKFIGLVNYTAFFGQKTLTDVLGFTLLLTVGRVLMVILAPLLLAVAVNEFGRKARLGLRLLFSLPLALFAPVAMALSWRLLLSPRTGLFEQGQRWLANPDQAQWTLVGIDALSFFGVACGLGLVVYLMALRGAGDSPATWPQVRVPLFAAWGLTVLATIALSLQEFSQIFLLTGGGPANRTMNLALLHYKTSFQMLNFGAGAAMASVLLFILMLLGLVAGVLVIALGLQLETIPPGKPAGLFSKSRRSLAVVLLVVALLVSLPWIGLGLLPALWTAKTALTGGADFARAVKMVPIGQAVLNTLVPTTAATLLIQLPLTYLAALGIGALRPLGRRSEWLLLPFSPWLLVSIGPLSIVLFERLRTAGLLNSMLGLVPPILVSLPMLFILALFFKGQELKWQAAQAAGQSGFKAFWQTIFLPSLPLTILLVGVALVVSQQDLIWPLLVVTKSNISPILLWLARLGSQAATSSAILSALLVLFGLPAFVVTLVILALFQIFYLDRLALSRAARDK